MTTGCHPLEVRPKRPRSGRDTRSLAAGHWALDLEPGVYVISIEGPDLDAENVWVRIEPVPAAGPKRIEFLERELGSTRMREVEHAIEVHRELAKLKPRESGHLQAAAILEASRGNGKEALALFARAADVVRSDPGLDDDTRRALLDRYSVFETIYPVYLASGGRYSLAYLTNRDDEPGFFWYDLEEDRKLGWINPDEPLINSPLETNVFLDFQKLHEIQTQGLTALEAGRAAEALALFDSGVEMVRTTNDPAVDSNMKQKLIERLSILRKIYPVYVASGGRFGYDIRPSTVERPGKPYVWVDLLEDRVLDILDPADPMKTSPVRIMVQ